MRFVLLMAIIGAGLAAAIWYSTNPYQGKALVPQPAEEQTEGAAASQETGQPNEGAQEIQPATVAQSDQQDEGDNKLQQLGTVLNDAFKVVIGTKTGQDRHTSIQAAREAGVQTPEPEPRPEKKKTARILLPPSLSNVQFGMTEGNISGRYRIHSSRLERGEKMLVYKADRRGQKQAVRFHFRSGHLYKVTLVMQPSTQDKAKALFETIRADLNKRYGELAKGSRRWSDETVSAGVDLKRNEVHLHFQHVAG